MKTDLVFKHVCIHILSLKKYPLNSYRALDELFAYITQPLY